MVRYGRKPASSGSPGQYDGDCARAYWITHSQESWMQTTVSATAAETLSFYWKVSSEANHDYLEFYLDGVLQSGRISGTVDWTQKSYTLSAGSHTLKWRYVKDGSGSAGSDRGWVDWVQWTGPPAAVPLPTEWSELTYIYDASGRRMAKKYDGTTVVKYLYDGDHCIAEYDGNNNLLRKYVYGPGVDEPVSMIESAGSYAGTYYYHFDGLGSVAALTNSAGSPAELYEYSVYGQVAASDANHPNRFLFTGREFDKDTGLYYYRARYYNPEIGRFLQTDPIGYGNGINWYRYCGNSPVLLVDPWGLCEGGYDYWSAFSDVSGLTSGYGDAVGETIKAIPGGAGDALAAFKDAVTRLFVDPGGLFFDAYSAARALVSNPIQTAAAAVNGFVDPLLSMDPAVSGQAIGELAGNAAIAAVGAKTIEVIRGPAGPRPAAGVAPEGSVAPSAGNTNPFAGPVDRRVFVVNPNGNVIEVPQGYSLTGSPNGQFLQLRGPTGDYTGLRLDGPHVNVPFSHAHVPGVGDHIPVN